MNGKKTKRSARKATKSKTANLVKISTTPRHPMIGALKGTFTFEPTEPKPRRHPLFGALKGTFTIDPEWDLTRPAMPEWADLIDRKLGKIAEGKPLRARKRSRA